MYEPRPSDITLPPTEPIHIVLPNVSPERGVS
jgi:hypothetical protein